MPGSHRFPANTYQERTERSLASAEARLSIATERLVQLRIALREAIRTLPVSSNERYLLQSALDADTRESRKKFKPPEPPVQIQLTPRPLRAAKRIMRGTDLPPLPKEEAE